jgi:capsule polysaccharide export protein KpsE/RkpR
MSNLKFFDIEVRNKKEFPDGTQTTLQFSRKNKNEQIDVDEMKKVLESLNKKANDEGDNLKIMIRALNIDKWYTFKGFDTDLEVEEFEDYFKDKVKNGEKFEKFSQMQITTFKTKK